MSGGGYLACGAFGPAGERQRALRLPGTVKEIRAAGVDRGPQRARNHAQVGDLCLDLGELDGSSLGQLGAGVAAARPLAGLQKTGDFR